MDAHALATELPMPVRFSYDFVDALEDPVGMPAGGLQGQGGP